MAGAMNKIGQLRAKMLSVGLDAYILPSGDEFMNEYVPPYAKRLEWFSSFSGSAGTAVVLEKKAAFFTDGRYILQATRQLPQGQYEVINIADIKPEVWLRANLPEGAALGINPMLYSREQIAKYQSFATVVLCDDLIDAIWYDKPQKPASIVHIHPVKYAGRDCADKVQDIITEIKEHEANSLLITSPDSICWLLNIRGRDVPNTPLVLARLFLEFDGSGVLFVDMPIFPLEKDGIDDMGECSNALLGAYLGDKIKIQPLKTLPEFLQTISGKKILLDKNSTPCKIFNLLEKKNTIIATLDPCTLPKARKNAIEAAGAKIAHVKDGVAVASFLIWLEKNYTNQDVTEISAAEKLLEFRQKDNDFVEQSFDTIAGFAENGAIVHYKASPETNKKIVDNGIFLLDSGGQYFSGTTDITRTIAIGKPTLEQKRNFTLVLKGHIAIATAVFPSGTTGHQLDILARQFLWKSGLDYDHGTGHGVGSFLGVHEGPQRISKAYSDVVLVPGMIISNEPGYYKNGEYGIRIENLVIVEEAGVFGNKTFLQFKTLTCVPIDLKLVDFKMLDEQEESWLKMYHMNVYSKLSGVVTKEVYDWLGSFIQKKGRK